MNLEAKRANISLQLNLKRRGLKELHLEVESADQELRDFTHEYEAIGGRLRQFLLACQELGQLIGFASVASMGFQEIDMNNLSSYPGMWIALGGGMAMMRVAAYFKNPHKKWMKTPESRENHSVLKSTLDVLREDSCDLAMEIHNLEYDLKEVDLEIRTERGGGLALCEGASTGALWILNDGRLSITV